VAVPLADAARATVLALVDEVAADPRVAAAGRLRWAVGEHLHLTIRFLGATAPGRVADVAAAAAAAALPQEPFEVRLAGAGGFPSGGRPRVVWLGLASGVPELTALAVRLEDGLVARGWPREDRPFRPHLTLARADGIPGAGRAVDALAAAAATLDAAWTADRLVVYRSELGRGPARYLPLAVVPLGGGSLPGDAPQE
jgi:RNA 2',3'-cyclic 3'-phosphodiesterase